MNLDENRLDPRGNIVSTNIYASNWLRKAKKHTNKTGLSVFSRADLDLFVYVILIFVNVIGQRS